MASDDKASSWLSAHTNSNAKTLILFLFSHPAMQKQQDESVILIDILTFQNSIADLLKKPNYLWFHT